MINESKNAAGFTNQADYFCALERARAAALVARDIGLARQLQAPDYQLISPSGVSFSSDRYLEKIEAGILVYLRWQIGQIAVRASDAMAMVRYQATLELASDDGKSTPIDCWHTDGYELRGDFWQAIWSQATAIRQPAGEPP